MIYRSTTLWAVIPFLCSLYQIQQKIQELFFSLAGCQAFHIGGIIMIESNQSKELGPKWFEQLQAEVASAPAEGLEQFKAAIKPDEMGFNGQEGIDDEQITDIV